MKNVFVLCDNSKAPAEALREAAPESIATKDDIENIKQFVEARIERAVTRIVQAFIAVVSLGVAVIGLVIAIVGPGAGTIEWMP